MSDISITFSGYQGPHSVHSRAIGVFAAALERSLGERLAFEHVMNVTEQGRNAVDLLTMTETGETTLCYFSASYLADRVAEIALFDLPFMIRDRAQAYAMLDGPLGRLIMDRMAEAAGFRIVAWWDNGFRHLTNGVRAIRTPADCRGLSIRTLFSDLYVETFEALGFTPVKLDVKDLPGAVADGTVDAQENPLTNTYNFGMHRHHRWITLTGHFFGPTAVLAHKDSWESWSAEDRAAVETALVEATMAQRGFAAAEDEEIAAKLDPAENELIRLSEDERAAFVAAVRPVVDRHLGRFRDELFEYLPLDH